MNFRRFNDFNAQTSHSLDWNTTTAVEMYEGHLIVVYRYKGVTYIQSRKSAAAREGKGLKSIYSTAFELFDRKYGKNWHTGFEDGWSVAFELLTPDTNPEGPVNSLRVIGVFDLKEGKEGGYNLLKLFSQNSRVACPQITKVSNPSEAVALCRTIPYGRKGILLEDANGTKVRMLKESYTDPAWQGIVMQKIAQAVLDKKWRKMVNYHPKYQNSSILFRKVIIAAKRVADNILEEVKDLSIDETSSRFYSHPLCSILVSMRTGRIATVEKGLQIMGPGLLVDLAKQFFPEEYKKIGKEFIDGTGN